MTKQHGKISRILAIIMVCSMIFGLTACGNKKSDSKSKDFGLDRKNTLIYGAEFEDEQVNPILSDEHLQCSTLLYRGLMKTNEKCEAEKDIASDVKISDDLLVYDFKIRKDVKFHDDTDLKVDDVIFTLNSILDKKVNSPLRPEFEVIKKVEKTGDDSLRITLKEPFPALLDKLTIGIIPEHAFKDVDKIEEAEFNKHPIGCGPYKFVEKEDGSHMILEAFDDFYGTKPSIKNIVIKPIPEGSARALQLKSGELDMTIIDPSQVKEAEKEKDLKIYKIPTADYRCVMFNFDATPIFKDVKVRQALCYDTDREGIVKSILHGYGDAAYSPLQINSVATSELEQYKYDPEKAKALLDEAGWVLPKDGKVREKDGKKLSFKIVSPVTDEVRTNLANYLADEWQKIGVDAKVDALDWGAIDIEKTDTFMLGWGSPFDPDNDTYRLFTTGSSDNYGGYSNPEVDKLLKEARLETDPEARKVLYQKFQQVLAEDPAYDLICYIDALYSANDKVEGICTEKVLGHHGAGIFWNIEEWKLKK